MRRLSAQDEGGAVAVIVALLLIVLFGMGAMAVDAGALYAERRQLQNGADAGALAIAEDCARGVISCVQAAVENVAQDYAESNANDNTALAEDVDLDYNPDAESRVTVTTLTQDGPTGPNTFPLMFAKVLTIDDPPVRARATARWGPAQIADGFPLAVCQDLWESNRPDPVTGDPGPTIDVRYKGTAADPPPNDCDDGSFPPGSNPGNFSWLDTSAGTCETEYDFSGTDPTATGDPGANLNADCQDEIDTMIAEILAHKDDPVNNDLPVRVVPIYSTVTDSGANATYTLVTLGAFEFSGLKTEAGQNVVVSAWNDSLCTGASAAHLCVQGRFVREVALGDIGAGADSDVIIIELIE